MALQHATYTSSHYNHGQTLSGFEWSTANGFLKNGHLPGSHAFVRHLADADAPTTGGGLPRPRDVGGAGASLVFLFNRYYSESGDPTDTLRSRLSDIETALAAHVESIADWGTRDLF